jgi:hypothetical protein
VHQPVVEVCLKIAFPMLYNIASVKEASVDTNMDLSSGTIHWNINFIRLAHDWEVEMLASLFFDVFLKRKERWSGQTLVDSVPQRDL